MLTSQYPYLITINALVPALLAGNTVLLRPSPQTPLVGEKLVQYFNEAGLPKNVLQVVHFGAWEVLDEIVKIPQIKLVSFVGSTQGGIRLRQATAGRIVPLNLELGGNDPAYVRADADLAYTAGQVVDGAVFNSGQSCCAIERVYVHADVHDAFVAEVQKELATYVTYMYPLNLTFPELTFDSYKLGNPRDKATTTGPVISHQAVKNIQSHIDDAVSRGAVDSTPKNSTFDALPSEGSFIVPRVLTNVSHDMRVMREETFGPVIPIMKVSSDDEAIALMNDSDYGLTASVWTKDIQGGEELIERIEAGTVFINRCDYPSPVSLPPLFQFIFLAYTIADMTRTSRGLDGRTPVSDAPSGHSPLMHSISSRASTFGRLMVESLGRLDFLPRVYRVVINPF
jgi:acyl-CoA reductase-like NAD-dependent aldehyde dehydrogenase